MNKDVHYWVYSFFFDNLLKGNKVGSLHGQE